jgi:hypothetical protein
MAIASQGVTCNNKGKEVTGTMDAREGRACDEIHNSQLTSSGGRIYEGTPTRLITRTGGKVCEGTYTGMPVRNGGKACDDISQGVASQVVATRSGSKKSGGSGRRPPTSPTL